jgi:alanine dehydrogenase
LATLGVHAAVSEDPELATGVNTVAGEVVHAAVAEALAKPCVPLADALPR